MIRFCLILCALLPALGHAAEPVLALTSAEFVLDDTVSPPSASAPWETLTLPDNWSRSRSGQGGIGWYRLRFDLDRFPEPGYALYVPKLSMSAEFFVNGVRIGSGGRMEEPVARNWNRPLLMGVPPSLLRVGGNQIDIRLYAYPDARGGLGEVLIGPESELRPAYDQRHLLRVTLPLLCSVVSVGLSLCALALWARRRSENTILFYGAWGVLWALRSTDLFIRDLSVSAFHWDVYTRTMFGWCQGVAMMGGMRYVGASTRRLEFPLLIHCLIGPLLMIFGGPSRLFATHLVWEFYLFITGCSVGIFICIRAYRQRTAELWAFAAGTLLCALSLSNDVSVQFDLLGFDSPEVFSYAMLPLYLIYGWLEMSRYGHALNEAEQLNRELEQRVADKQAELAATYVRIQNAERQQAIAEERQRIMSDMHDGIGSQLIQAVQLVEFSQVSRADIARELRECLDSLRMTVDSLQENDDDLLTVLGNFRYRIEGRLKESGIDLHWQVTEVPALKLLTPRNVLHILRIVQEMFTNVIRHAQATTIAVQTGTESHRVFIRVIDNGNGLDGQGQGRGLASMRRRAQHLGGELQLTHSPEGTQACLFLPLDHPVTVRNRIPGMNNRKAVGRN